jgi:hypothetical protein
MASATPTATLAMGSNMGNDAIYANMIAISMLCVGGHIRLSP